MPSSYSFVSPMALSMESLAVWAIFTAKALHSLMAKAGESISRSSRRVSRTLVSRTVSFARPSSCFEKGSSRAVVIKLNRLCTRAMPTAFMGESVNSNRNSEFSA